VLTRSYVQEESEGSREAVETYKTRFGWLDLVNNLANNDHSKWDHFFRLPIRELFNVITFYREKQAHDRQQNIQQQAGLKHGI